MAAISIHAPPRGATPASWHASLTTGDFNSRPSARGDAYSTRCTMPVLLISIHAPPRGATPQPHSPTAGRQFQFTPLREGRRRGRNAPRGRGGISIHAPPRGATSGAADSPTAWQQFQFTPLREGRQKGFAPGKDREIFQFTPLREGRRDARGQRHARRHFNSRPSARGDAHGGAADSTTAISIHAPPRGATRRKKWYRDATRFQFTPLREGRHWPDVEDAHILPISIHAPPRGATRTNGKGPGINLYFNSRPSARGDPAPRQGKRHAPYFNSRPSARGDRVG